MDPTIDISIEANRQLVVSAAKALSESYETMKVLLNNCDLDEGRDLIYHTSTIGQPIRDLLDDYFDRREDEEDDECRDEYMGYLKNMGNLNAPQSSTFGLHQPFATPPMASGIYPPNASASFANAFPPQMAAASFGMNTNPFAMAGQQYPFQGDHPVAPQPQMNPTPFGMYGYPVATCQDAACCAPYPGMNTAFAHSNATMQTNAAPAHYSNPTLQRNASTDNYSNPTTQRNDDPSHYSNTTVQRNAATDNYSNLTVQTNQAQQQPVRNFFPQSTVSQKQKTTTAEVRQSSKSTNARNGNNEVQAATPRPTASQRTVQPRSEPSMVTISSDEVDSDTTTNADTGHGESDSDGQSQYLFELLTKDSRNMASAEQKKDDVLKYASNYPMNPLNALRLYKVKQNVWDSVLKHITEQPQDERKTLLATMLSNMDAYDATLKKLKKEGLI